MSNVGHKTEMHEGSLASVDIVSGDCIYPHRRVVMLGLRPVSLWRIRVLPLKGASKCVAYFIVCLHL